MKYYIIAGEASGDLHGSNLIREIRKIDVDAHIRAWGGDRMKEAGAQIVRHYRDHNFMGFIEVAVHLRKILSNFRFCKSDILSFNPDVIIFIDFPGFNLRIAKWAKEHNFKNIYYISPQIWAWKSSRIHTIRQSVDKLISILPFEQEFYRKYNMHVDYVGHPLLDVLQNNQHNVSGEKNLITLLPGSRKQEIRNMLPVMTIMVSKFPEYEFVIAGVSTIERKFYEKYSAAPVRIEYDSLYTLLACSRAAIVTSGTATLETALCNVPLVVCYKGSLLSYHIAKRLIKVSYISLVNLIMNKPVVRELIQHEMNEENLSAELHKLVNSEKTRQTIFEDYHELRQKLGEQAASARAARIIYNFLKTG